MFPIVQTAPAKDRGLLPLHLQPLVLGLLLCDLGVVRHEGGLPQVNLSYFVALLNKFLTLISNFVTLLSNFLTLPSKKFFHLPVVVHDGAVQVVVVEVLSARVKYTLLFWRQYFIRYHLLVWQLAHVANALLLQLLSEL